jgi:hypothetical protein
MTYFQIDIFWIHIPSQWRFFFISSDLGQQVPQHDVEKIVESIKVHTAMALLNPTFAQQFSAVFFYLVSSFVYSILEVRFYSECL